jgi:hypothetical protein
MEIAMEIALGIIIDMEPGGARRSREETVGAFRSI